MTVDYGNRDIHFVGFGMRMLVRSPVNELEHQLRFVLCSECAALILDDTEGANRTGHAEFHENVWETLQALRDGKADETILAAL